MDFDTPLNTFFDNVFANILDRKAVDTNSTRYDMIERSANRQFKIDYLDGSTVYKAIVLHVYTDGEDDGWWAQATDVVRRVAGRDGKYYRVRARIPELHAHIPVPCSPGTDNKKNRAIIEMHPLFVSRGESIQGTLEVGDIVNVGFTKGPKYGLQAGGILLSKYADGVGGVQAAPGSTGCESLTGIFDPSKPRRVQQLGNTFPDQEGERNLIEEAAQTESLETEQQIRAARYARDNYDWMIDGVFIYGPTETPYEATSEFGERCAPCVDWKPGRAPGDTVINSDGSRRPGGNRELDCKTFGSSDHQGIDLGAPTGTPVRSPFGTADTPGKVIYAGNSGGSAGTVVKISYRSEEPELNYEVGYYHLSAIATNIRVGANVLAGDHLGNSGATGGVTNPHLHITVSDNGVAVEPRDYFPVGSFTNSRTPNRPCSDGPGTNRETPGR